MSPSLNDDLLLETSDVSVKYCKDLKKSLWFGANDIVRELSGRRPPALELRESEMWALQHVNIRLRRGECLGVVGANGAGKSTLLKVLNGIFKPDSGIIRVRGRTGALLELGTGFNSTLTGRENVFINGVILGMSRREVAQRFDEIVAFSEVGEFIDSPVKSYSSGMALRLAFSVAIQMEPDLLLIDEILGVGDVGFRTKCYARMEKLLNTSAVVFVSHSMAQVARLCTSLMVLDHGRVVYHGNDVPRGIEHYHSLFEKTTASSGIGEGARIFGVSIVGDDHLPPAADDTPRIGYMQAVRLTIDLELDASDKQARISILFYDRETRGIAEVAMKDIDFCGGARRQIEVRINGLPFNPGRYIIAVSLLEAVSGDILHTRHNTAEFQLEGDDFGQTPVRLEGNWTISGP